MSQKAVVYIGEFDLRNENVQAHLVKNNGKLLKQLGYEVFFIGTNRNCSEFSEVEKLEELSAYSKHFLELPHTLTMSGLMKERLVEKKIIDYLNDLKTEYNLAFVITYQAPTYAKVLKRIADWCENHNTAYIVNCADLPVFDSQMFLRRIVMNINWNYMHRINKKYADGVISVSRYIDDFYRKEGRPSVIIPPLFDEPNLIESSVEMNDVPVFLYAGTPFVINGQEVNPKGMKDRLDKIVDLMLKVEANGTSFCLKIVGITMEDYCTCIPRHKESLKKSQNIVFYGRKSHKDTLQMLWNADYMVNYRDSNLMTEAGMSTKVVESISLGTPVVMNNIGDTFSYLEEGSTGIVLTGQADRDVKTITKLCVKSADERKDNKINTRMSGTFSLEKYLPVMEDFLKAVNEN